MKLVRPSIQRGHLARTYGIREVNPKILESYRAFTNPSISCEEGPSE